MTPRTSRAHANERGVALILALLLMLAASVLASAMMLLSQTETYASMNYRAMSQARYAAESGVHKTINYLLNSYTPPTASSATDPLSNYDTTKSPVQYSNGWVVLTARTGEASNYPSSAVRTAFTSAAAGTLSAGNQTVSYQAAAVLLSLRVVNGTTIATWRITSDGIVSGARTATVEVSAVLEKQITAVQNNVYAAFAQASTCGALQFSGDSRVDSYDSTAALVSGSPVISNSSGNVGTNGNLDANNSSTVYGSLSTPRVGVGNCSAGNVDALSTSGGATVTGGIVHLAQSVVPPTPTMPSPWTNPGTYAAFTDVSGCRGVSGCSLVSGTQLRFAPGSYGDIHTTNSATLHLSAGTYNINSLNMDNATSLVLDSGPVVINIVGQGVNGNSTALFINSSVTSSAANRWDPTQLTLNYAGTARVTWNNQGTSVAQLNAPNATVTVQSSVFYGSVIGNTVSFTNAARLHFDRHLSSGASSGTTIGPDMLTAFSWKKQ